ncbi:MAG TPA: cytochrome P460 family protein [Vicinamibacterales bacterium]|nr:cytochrome P460 family protein [Vicinamibacterales bacterium]
MKRRHVIAVLVVLTSVWLVSLTVAAQDQGSLKIPNGLAFSEFKGYEAWQLIAPSQTDESIKAVVGNPVMIKAYMDGIPANGRAVPDGAMMAKIEWSRQPNPESPYAVNVPGALKSLAFMVKDAKRFAASGGWGYAKFDADASGKLAPAGTGSACGYACHTRAKAHDFVFTHYRPR